MNSLSSLLMRQKMSKTNYAAREQAGFQPHICDSSPHDIVTADLIKVWYSVFHQCNCLLSLVCSPDLCDHALKIPHDEL